jgi:hypothetical protein
MQGDLTMSNTIDRFLSALMVVMFVTVMCASAALTIPTYSKDLLTWAFWMVYATFAVWISYRFRMDVL